MLRFPCFHSRDALDRNLNDHVQPYKESENRLVRVQEFHLMTENLFLNIYISPDCTEQFAVP